MDTDATPKSNSNGRKQTLLIFGIPVAIVFFIIGVLLYIQSTHHESTDDAIIDGHLIPISSKVAGQVNQVQVTDNQPVKANDPLVLIDPRDYQAKLDQQRAKVAVAEAEARRAGADAQRYADIFARDEISKQQFDNAQAAALSAHATLEKEQASLQQAELDLSYTQLTAPEAGRVTKKSVEPGAYVQVGQALMVLVPYQVWVTANFKETQLTHIQAGQKVKIKVDSYPGKIFEGHVDSIQSGTGERFSVLPSENATGNYVKVVQRVPVKIAIDTPLDPKYLLAPGMSVEPSVTIN